MKLFVVRGQNLGEPESYLLGVYDNATDAYSRQAEVQYEEDASHTHIPDISLDYVWIDEVKLGQSVCEANR